MAVVEDERREARAGEALGEGVQPASLRAPKPWAMTTHGAGSSASTR
jgi:hypothetical protein